MKGTGQTRLELKAGEQKSDEQSGNPLKQSGRCMWSMEGMKDFQKRNVFESSYT